MLNVLLPTWWRRSPRVWLGVFGCLSLALALPPTHGAYAQVPSKDANTPKPAAPKADADDDDTPKPQTKAGAPTKKEDGVQAPDAADADSANEPSLSRKVVPNEVFRDPKAEKLLEIEKFPAVGKAVVANTEILELNAMAGGVSVVNTTLIDRVVDAMAAKLTDHANIQALIDPPDKQSPSAPVARAIDEATRDLLEPIYLARSAKNAAFLTAYNRALLAKLTPLLKNHLVPRVQAMIVLGQSASTDLAPTYVAQIKEPNQTVWVKLWALEGIVNTIEEGGRLQNESQIAKAVSDFLSSSDDIPWPAQLRALEALSALRQGFEPNRPRLAAMASAAMTLLANADAKIEVRSEAAKALGLMQISTAVPKYNYQLVAHSVGLLAAELGSEINSLVPARAVKGSTKTATAPDDAAKPSSKVPKGKTAAPAAPAPTPTTGNPVRAKYLASLLVGRVYQAFDGVPGMRGDPGGLVHSASGEGVAYSQKVFELVRSVTKASIDLIYAGSRQINDKKKDLDARVEALRDFLEKNAPPDRHLVQGGVDFPLAQAAAAAEPAAEPAEPAPPAAAPAKSRAKPK